MRLGATVPAALALSVATLAASACGTDDISPESVADAAQATIEAGGSRIAIRSTVSGPDGKIELVGSGVQNAKGSRGRLELGPSSRTKLTGADPDDLRFKAAFEGDVVYMRSPAFRGDLPAGKKWIKIDLGEAQRGLGTDQISQVGGNPTETLGKLRAVADVDKLGSEAVRGVECTHYKATIDLRKLPSRLPPAERARAQRGVERLIKLNGGDSTQEVEVWIDDDKLVRREKGVVSQEVAPGTRVTIVQTMEFFDFGVTTAVRLPPPDQVQDVTREAVSEVRKRSD